MHALCRGICRCGDVDGFDPYTQEWYDSGCAEEAETTCPGTIHLMHAHIAQCSIVAFTTTIAALVSSTTHLPSHQITSIIQTALPTLTTAALPTSTFVATVASSSSLTRIYLPVGVALGVAATLVVVAIALCVLVLVYGYKRPTSRVGMAMIQVNISYMHTYVHNSTYIHTNITYDNLEIYCSTVLKLGILIKKKLHTVPKEIECY